MLGVPRGARAEAPAREVAQESFAQGERAFRAGDYRSAADAFERAFTAAPHPAVLWNLGRSRELGGESARAATAYAEFLRQSPPDARGRDSATRSLVTLEKNLGRIIVLGVAPNELRVDGERVVGATVYVLPGSHAVGGANEAHKLRSVRVSAGGQETVSFEAARPTPTPEPVAASPRLLPPPAEGSRERPAWRSPWIVAVGGALTVAGAGFVTWSGLDTEAAKRSFDEAPSASGLDDGRAAQTRTNVLLGITAGVAIVTAVYALVVVDWSPRDAGPRSASLRLKERPGAQCVFGP